MARVEQSPLYSEAQLAQQQQIKMLLGQLHQGVQQLLRDTLNSYLTPPEYARVGDKLRIFAIRIRSLVDRSAQIRQLAVAENDITPVVVIGTQCEHCAYLDEDPNEEIARSSQNRHADLIGEINALLDLAQQVEDRVAARCTKLPPPAKFFGGLAALKRTLVQEQKSLLRSSDRLRLINLEKDDSKFCRKCGRPFNSEPSDGMQDELMQ